MRLLLQNAMPRRNHAGCTPPVTVVHMPWPAALLGTCDACVPLRNIPPVPAAHISIVEPLKRVQLGAAPLLVEVAPSGVRGVVSRGGGGADATICRLAARVAYSTVMPPSMATSSSTWVFSSLSLLCSPSISSVGCGLLTVDFWVVIDVWCGVGIDMLVHHTVLVVLAA